MATVTVYNDDEHGRAIRVVQVNPFSATISEPKIQEASKDGGGGCHQYQVRNGEMLIITTAEMDSPPKPKGDAA